MKEHFPGIDLRVARRRFERAATTYAGASRVESEIGSRMLERLDYLKVTPRRILDAGSGPGRDARRLAERFGGAEVVAADFSLQMLTQIKNTLLGRLLRRKPLRLCAELARLPLAHASVDFVWSNMALHWAEEPLAALREFSRVLAPEGLLMFSTLGPDTLKELREAAGEPRVHAFVDMHDLGDMLVESGFIAPVMDMEAITLVYADKEELLADLRRSGQTSARSDRPRGLSGKRFHDKLRSALGNKATFEVVYGHAWKGVPRKLADGRDIVQFRASRAR